MLLKPQCVVDKCLNREGVGRLQVMLLEVLRELILLARIGEVRGPPIRTQKHAFRHMFTPELQRLPKDCYLQSTFSQVCSS